MKQIYSEDDTIASISTATGNAGIGIVRMSGKNSFDIINKIFVPKNKNTKIEGYRMKYGNIINPKDKQIIDEVLVSYFVGPKSYTRDDMCEINTHGGSQVEKEILEICLENGARLAEPGEFTKRAFLNGRIDLAQAEAIESLINSKSEAEAKESINQLNGSLSKKINEIDKKLLEILTNIEVTIDYPEYDIDEIEGFNVKKELLNVKDLLIKLEKSFEVGKLLKDGIKTVILGKPNSGKSSLLNAILDEDRAIVSDIEGTTRDTIEEYIQVKGLTLKLIDTAGIRKSDNEIEKIGVNKSLKMAKDADLIIAIFDITKDLNEDDRKILDLVSKKNSIIILNKIDLMTKNKKIEDELNNLDKPIVKISAINREGIDELYNQIEKLYSEEKISNDNKILITNERHKKQISLARKDIEEAIKSVEKEVPDDLISINIKNVLEDLGEITGKNVSEDIINEIFKRFCLGK